MIAGWMAAASVFALLLGVAALAVETALRAGGRQARVAWLVALAVGVAWPVSAPLAASLLPQRAEGAEASVPGAVTSVLGTIAPALPALPDPWVTRIDPLLLALWGIATAVLLLRLAAAWRALAAVERAATVGQIAGMDVLVTPSSGPAVFGLRRPRLLVPRWLLDLDATLRALVMRHEAEHLEARDPQLAFATALLVALVPWNPGVWWMARRLRLAMELDCDVRVLRAAPDRERYGRLLLFIAQRQSRTNVTMLTESTSDLSRRIIVMNKPRPTHQRASIAILSLVAAGAVACSAKYGTDLATTRGAVVQESGPSFYSPEGAKPASPLPGPPAPAYPASLARQRVEGEVLVQFVIDSSGGVLPGSLRFVRFTDSLFAAAVRAAVPAMRFVPPELNGRRIRQLVQQTVYFDIRGSVTNSARRPAPPARPTTDASNRTPMPLRPIVVTVP
jgi:TonB family protein